MAEEYVLPSRRKRGHGRRARTSRGRRVTNEERIDKKNGWFHRKNMLAEMLGSKHNIVDIVNVRYPSEFRHVAVSAASVRRTVEVKFPGNPASLPPLPPTGTIVLKAPIPNIPRNVNHPAFIGIRVEAGFRPSLHKFLIRKYDRLVALGLPHTTKPEPQRSTSLAWHLAVWSTYSSRPRITAESRPKDPAAAACVDSFLRGVRRHISPLVSNILFRYAPKTWIRQQRANARVRSILRREFARSPGCDLGGAFFSVAVRDGSSEVIHLDWNDENDSITWIIPLGDWEGGELCFPQLACKVPIKAGQMYGGMMRLVAHCSAPVTKGRRVVLTCFTSKPILTMGDRYRKR